jgi:hypothetical protein
MSTIGGASWPSSDLLTSLFAGSSNPSPASSAPRRPPTDRPDSSDRHRDPATRVDLSDKVKAILARASTDQDVADRLKAFVASSRSGATADTSAKDATSPTGQDSKTSPQTDVNAAFAQLSGDIPASDGSQDGQPLQVGQNFATGLKADGYTISAIARASDGSYQIEIVGPEGKSFLDRRFGSSDEFSTFGGIAPGVSAQTYQRGNTDYITFSQSEAAAMNVTASSDAGSVSVTSLGAKTDSVTFTIDFNTGAISMAQSESISVSTAVQIGQPGSSFSTFA